MAEDPINQQQFEEDILAAAGAGSSDGHPFGDMGGMDMGGDFKMPSVEEVWKIIQEMDGISDEEKENLRDSLYNPQSGSADDFMKRYAQGAVSHTRSEYITFITMIVIILLVFALFGYKLYKSLMEKELKKQEKLKNKQSKKSKKSN